MQLMKVVSIIMLILRQTKAEVLVPCSKAFCAKYLENNVCPVLGADCDLKIPNFNGLQLPFPGPCNCCPYCLEYLALGDDCAKGEANSIVPVNICGPGLTCGQKSSESPAKCERITTTACRREQIKYDDKEKDGTLGNLEARPVCDSLGNYAAIKCIPGEVCYCVDEDGERIFGETPYSALSEKLMKCKCSRHNTQARKFLPAFANSFTDVRCNSDGSFDSIQCIDQKCFCVDQDDGKPTYPDQAMVKMTSINNVTMPCFIRGIHVEYDYYRPCEYDYHRNFANNLKFVKEGFKVYGSVYPRCQMDGYYAPVQQDSKTVFCAAPDGKVLENFVLPLGDPMAEEMNCNCARTRSLIPSLEKPVCKKNGNYRQMQCRRGECRCVDANGNQVHQEIAFEFRDQLPCFNQ